MYNSLDELISQALIEFAELPSDEPAKANTFFEKFGAGNVPNIVNLPYERLIAYEKLLNTLMTSDYSKYQLVHKGTPFYFMAWLSFDIRNYEKALYYIDAAISEDVRIPNSDWINQPASHFLTLIDPDDQVASRTLEETRKILDTEISRFNAISGLPQITIDTFISRFVQPLIKNPPNRTIISAFYVFLLEYSERQQELQMRSIGGGSIAPFILHLFSGALIFESVLKYLFPLKDDSQPVKTLGDIFNTSTFRQTYHFNILTSANLLSEILTLITDDSNQTAFTTTSKIRNTTGHNLIWDDIFASPQQYQLLFYQEVNSIFYLISHNF